MTDLETFAREHAKKERFYDRHEERAYRRATALAMRIVQEPELIQRGAEFLEAHLKGDPHQAIAYQKWRVLLTGSPESIALALLEDSPDGDEYRNTAPVFFTITPTTAKSLWADMS